VPGIALSATTLAPVLLAQQPAGGPQPSFFSLGNPLVLMIVTFGIFWFLLIAPARKRQKHLQRTIEALKSGDRVVTTGGILGTVVAVTDRIVQLRVASDVKIEVLKSAIAGLDSQGKQGS
jgi:preprotein translocase subunit YajC